MINNLKTKSPPENLKILPGKSNIRDRSYTREINIEENSKPEIVPHIRLVPTEGQVEERFMERVKRFSIRKMKK